MKQLQNEIHNIHKSVEQLADKQMKSLLQAYKHSLNSIRDEIGRIYMRYSVNGELKISRQQRYSILLQLEKKLLEQAKKLGQLDNKITTQILEEVFKESFFMHAYVIEKGIDVMIDFSILRPEFVKAAVTMPIKGKMFSDRIWDNKTKLCKRLRDEIEKGMIQGDSIDKMARRIKNEFGTSSYESKRLISNEMARCMSQAQEEVYRNSGIVKEVLFDATLDEKTSTICENLDSKVFILGEHPRIPQDTHVNCRSCIIPKLPNWKPTKKRENIKGTDGKKPIIDYSTYKEWKKSRGVDT